MNLLQRLRSATEASRRLCVRLITAKAVHEEGASLVEYALLVALIAVACVVAITTLGGNVSSKLSQAGSSIGS